MESFADYLNGAKLDGSLANLEKLEYSKRQTEKVSLANN